MANRQRVTIRLSHSSSAMLDHVTQSTGRSRNELIQNALDAFLAPQQSAPANFNRMAQTTEYMQVVADLVISREMPEKRDAILATVAQRLEKFHGSR